MILFVPQTADRYLAVTLHPSIRVSVPLLFVRLVRLTHRNRYMLMQCLRNKRSEKPTLSGVITEAYVP